MFDRLRGRPARQRPVSKRLGRRQQEVLALQSVGDGELIIERDDRDAIAARGGTRLRLTVEWIEAADLGQRAATGQYANRQDDGGREAELGVISLSEPTGR